MLHSLRVVRFARGVRKRWRLKWKGAESPLLFFFLPRFVLSVSLFSLLHTELGSVLRAFRNGLHRFMICSSMVCTANALKRVVEGNSYKRNYKDNALVSSFTWRALDLLWRMNVCPFFSILQVLDHTCSMRWATHLRSWEPQVPSTIRLRIHRGWVPMQESTTAPNSPCSLLPFTFLSWFFFKMERCFGSRPNSGVLSGKQNSAVYLA